MEYYRSRGNWRLALRLCEEWTRSSPNLPAAFRALVSLLRNQSNVLEMKHEAARWSKARPDDEEFEFIYYDCLQEALQQDEQERLVRARLNRNQQDAWGWRELSHLLIGRAATGDASYELESEIEETVARAVSLAPRDCATLLLQARLAEADSNWNGSIDLLLQALLIDPGLAFAYSRVWDNAAKLSLPQQETVLDRLQERLLLTSGHLGQARPLALRIASRMGVDPALARIQQWRSRRPNDPELILAHADVLLVYGRGRTDAVQAADMLESCLRRYPQHHDLRLCLANAYAKLLNDQARREILSGALEVWPLHSQTRLEIANDLVTKGAFQDAIGLLPAGGLSTIPRTLPGGFNWHGSSDR